MKVEILKAEKTCNGRKILDAADVTIESGRIYALMGPNGAGKTTLLRSIAGMEENAATQIVYNGSEKLPREQVAYMTQSSYLFDTTVRKNVQLGIEGRGFSQREMDLAIDEALAKVGMSNFSRVKAKSLSGGEAQRVALARVMIMKKKLVLLDEPSSATDLNGADLIETYIKECNKIEGTTFIFTTHSPSQAKRIAHEILFINKGRITEKGDPQKILSRPESIEAEEFIKNWKI